MPTPHIEITQPPAAGGASSHADLTSVTSDQHHDKSHAHSGADGSGTVAHSATTGKTADDHHAQAHVVTGADHTASGLTIGQVLRASSTTAFAFAQLAHADLGTVTSDQHHAKSHAHDGADGSGTVAHAALTSVTANQHHNQAHTDTDHDAATVKAVGGGKETLQAHSTMGSTETFDLANGNVHTGTLDANLTVTLSGSTASVGCSLTLILTQDGTGPRTITWPASVKWQGGSAPALNTGANKVHIFSLTTVDNGTTWYAFLAGDDMR